MTDPNPQAVEAAAKAMYGVSGEGAALAMEHASAALKAAEPHIRSQLLTELAEWFDEMREEKHYIGYGAAADRIRELAAKGRFLSRADVLAALGEGEDSNG